MQYTINKSDIDMTETNTEMNYVETTETNTEMNDVETTETNTEMNDVETTEKGKKYYILRAYNGDEIKIRSKLVLSFLGVIAKQEEDNINILEEGGYPIISLETFLNIKSLTIYELKAFLSLLKRNYKKMDEFHHYIENKKGEIRRFDKFKDNKKNINEKYNNYFSNWENIFFQKLNNDSLKLLAMLCDSLEYKTGLHACTHRIAYYIEQIDDLDKIAELLGVERNMTLEEEEDIKKEYKWLENVSAQKLSLVESCEEDYECCQHLIKKQFGELIVEVEGDDDNISDDEFISNDELS
jgi:hypothetical protein